MHRPTLIASVLFVLTGVAARAQSVAPVEAFPAPPQGFDRQREGIARGTLETVEYESTTVGSKRKARVHLPPGMSRDAEYPVLYLLHGIGGDENEWARNGAPDVILDNLYADMEAVPMIVVMPNGRASTEVTARDPIPRQSPAFALFERDLLDDLVPFIERTYPVKRDRDGRAIAGLSMGGGQALNFGLGNLATFAWVGGFSSAPNTRRPEELVPDVEEAVGKLKLLYVACGDRDGLFRISEGVHRMLEEKHVPHAYRVVAGGGHDFAVWKSDLYHLARLLFRDQAASARADEPTAKAAPPTKAVKEERRRIIPLVVVAPGESKTVFFACECPVGPTRGGGLSVTRMDDQGGKPVARPAKDPRKLEHAGVTISVPDDDQAARIDKTMRAGTLTGLAKVRPVFPVTVTAAPGAQPVAIDIHLADSTCAGHCQTDFTVVVAGVAKEAE